MDKSKIPKEKIIRSCVIEGINKELEDLIKEVEFRVLRIRKLSQEILNSLWNTNQNFKYARTEVKVVNVHIKELMGNFVL